MSIFPRRLKLACEIAARFCADGTDAGICLFAAHRGEVVLEEAIGTSDNGQPLSAQTKFLYLSASKPLTAVAVAVLVERGLLAWSDPLGRHIPEMTEPARSLITVEHLLTHRAGIPDFFGKGLNEVAWHDWKTGVQATIELPLEYLPGTKVTYHPLSYGLLGELIPRLDGRAFADFFQAEVAEPAGMTSFTWGLPAGNDLPVTGTGLEGQESTAAARRFQTQGVNNAVLPAANGWGTARDLGRFYMALGAGGGGILSPATVRRLITANPIPDPEVIRAHGYGFEVGQAPAGLSPFGDLAGPRTFGHPGMRSTVGWCDPDSGLSVAILCNGAPALPEGNRRLSILSDAFHRWAATASGT